MGLNWKSVKAVHVTQACEAVWIQWVAERERLPNVVAAFESALNRAREERLLP
jgi:hypothetical protein